MAEGFEQLNIWKKGFELLMSIYNLTSVFPKEEKYGLASQLRNSANSIIANIAESQGRYYFADKIRVLYIARGECEETRSHLKVALNLKYIDNKESETLNNAYKGLFKGISAYINSLRKTNN